MKLPKSSGKPRRYSIYIRQVTGRSMLPAFKPGGLVLGWGGYRRLRTGDVVILQHDGLEKIKRIQRIRSDLIFVIGDNPAQSTDSRTAGWLSVTQVRARVIWPRR